MLDWPRGRAGVERWEQRSWGSGCGSGPGGDPGIPGDRSSSIPAGPEFKSRPTFHRWVKACGWVPPACCCSPRHSPPPTQSQSSHWPPCLCYLLTFVDCHQHDVMSLVSSLQHTVHFYKYTEEGVCSLQRHLSLSNLVMIPRGFRFSPNQRGRMSSPTYPVRFSSGISS